MIRDILTLGDPKLYEVSAQVKAEEYGLVQEWVTDLHDTLMAYREKHGAGRAVAAPQIGIKKRLIYMHITQPCVLINPVLAFPDDEKYELMDDCMSFPGLLVKVSRYKRAVISYLDAEFCAQTMRLEGDLAELLQHEYDHLDGILATMRAVDDKAFYMKELKRDFSPDRAL